MYKVVKRENGLLISCIINKSFLPSKYVLHKWQVKYTPYKSMKAKKGDVFIFKYLKDAEYFINSVLSRLFDKHSYEIWECEAKNVKKVVSLAKLLDDFFKLFWGGELLDEFTSPSPSSSFMSIPRGSYRASSIKLTKRVRAYGQVDQYSPA